MRRRQPAGGEQQEEKPQGGDAPLSKRSHSGDEGCPGERTGRPGHASKCVLLADGDPHQGEREREESPADRVASPGKDEGTQRRVPDPHHGDEPEQGIGAPVRTMLELRRQPRRPDRLVEGSQDDQRHSQQDDQSPSRPGEPSHGAGRAGTFPPSPRGLAHAWILALWQSAVKVIRRRVARASPKGAGGATTRAGLGHRMGQLRASSAVPPPRRQGRYLSRPSGWMIQVRWTFANVKGMR